MSFVNLLETENKTLYQMLFYFLFFYYFFNLLARIEMLYTGSFVLIRVGMYVTLLPFLWYL